MHTVKTMIKMTARFFGLEINRYAHSQYTECYNSTDLFNCWVGKLQATGPLRIVFDVGANRGQTVVHYRTEFPKATIYAFEPSVAAFSELKAGTVDDPLIRPINIALGVHDGCAMLHENEDGATNSLLPNSRCISQFAPPEMVAPKNETRVPCMRIDTFCANESIGCIDLLKIDAQGYERYILDGAGSLLSPETIRGVFIEALFVDLYENQAWCGEVLESLRERGYRLFGFTNVAFDDTYGWKWADAMFIANS